MSNPFFDKTDSVTTNPFVSISPPVIIPKYGKKKKYITTYNTDYSSPILSTHEDYNNSEDVIERLTNNYYLLILDKWLFKEEYESLFNYFKLNNKKIQVLSKPLEKKNKTEKDKIKIAEYIEDNILRKRKLKKLIQSFVDKKDIDWVDLPYKESSLRSFLKKKLKKIIIKYAKD